MFRTAAGFWVYCLRLSLLTISFGSSMAHPIYLRKASQLQFTVACRWLDEGNVGPWECLEASELWIQIHRSIASFGPQNICWRLPWTVVGFRFGPSQQWILRSPGKTTWKYRCQIHHCFLPAEKRSRRHRVVGCSPCGRRIPVPASQISLGKGQFKKIKSPWGQYCQEWDMYFVLFCWLLPLKSSNTMFYGQQKYFWFLTQTDPTQCGDWMSWISWRIFETCSSQSPLKDLWCSFGSCSISNGNRWR